MPSLPKFTSFVKSTDNHKQRTNGLLKKTIDKSFPVVGDQQALGPAYVVNVEGTAAVHGVLSKRSYGQQGTLPTVVSC
jgi:hypothetical protein